MKPPRSAHAVTVAVIALLGGFVVWQRMGRPSVNLASDSAVPKSSQGEPRDAIYAMVDAERQGDVAAYLSGFAGNLKISLEQTSKEMTPEGFRQSLQERNKPVKGVAISEEKTISDHEAGLKVDFVYEDHNETQMFYLEKMNGAWKIARIDRAESVKPAVPYGTSVR